MGWDGILLRWDLMRHDGTELDGILWVRVKVRWIEISGNGTLPSEFGITCGIMKKENANVLLFSKITFINCKLLTKIICIILHIDVDCYLNYIIVINESL